MQCDRFACELAVSARLLNSAEIVFMSLFNIDKPLTLRFSSLAYANGELAKLAKEYKLQMSRSFIELNDYDEVSFCNKNS